MVSSEPFHSLFDSDETGSSSRISFSSEFLDESNFITICPNPRAEREEQEAKERERSVRNVEFEFLSETLNNNSSSSSSNMIAADELFVEGKMLPFWDAEKLKRINFKSEGADEEVKKKEESRMTTWFVDEDPSPRPPKCTTVLWKELLKLKKLQRSSTLSNSNSNSNSSCSSSFSFSSSSSSSSTRIVNIRGEEEKKGGVREREKCSKRTKKGQSSMRIRPVLNVPICTHAKNAAVLPPLFSLRRGRLHR